jgi:hypothetical protein
MAGVNRGGVNLHDDFALRYHAAQRRYVASMVGNIILMIVLVLFLTFGGFLFMDYKVEEARAKKMDKRVIELRKQFEQGCEK